MIRKKKFAVAALDSEDKAFIVYITFIGKHSDVYSSCRAQIVFLKANKASTFVSFKYADFADVFSRNLVAKLSKHSGINDYIINLIKDQ